MTKSAYITLQVKFLGEEVVTSKDYLIKEANSFEEFIEELDTVYVDFTSTLKDESISTEG